MWRQRAEQRLEAAVGEMSGFLETSAADFIEQLQQNKTLSAAFNPRVRLHRLVLPADVQQTELIKEEAPEEWRPGVDQQDQQDPGTLHIKEEEELWTSLDVEQLSVKEEADDTKFSCTADPLKSEDDEEKPLFLQLHQHQVEEGDLPTSSSADQMTAAAGGEVCGGAETIRNPDLSTHDDESSSSQTEVSEEGEDDEELHEPDFQLKDLSDLGSEPEDSDWKKSRAPETGGVAAEQIIPMHSCNNTRRRETGSTCLQRRRRCEVYAIPPYF
ncbi:uncharacterized protein LOC108239215 isoform X2 [Kryptolebias marmoratus]|uniref:uncharacterized protein LOC108239215 isoform X2 n=1 Tax=Kryptolebias marmoratus TaxID=37003 RepID=UPI0007F86C68|nr:uncharacterized protein LOC108239215 isoform X2 [Kryptolebias marmoratus]